MMDHLDIHFLNVGHGDCTIVDFPSGHLTMVDINNSTTLSDDEQLGLALEKGITLDAFKMGAVGKPSWEQRYKSRLVDPANYFKTVFQGRTLFRYIQTHPDMDHLSGLCRFFWEEEIDLTNFWDTKHTKTFEESTFDKSRYDWNDWLVYKLMRTGRVQKDNPHQVIHNLQGRVGEHWSADGITILSPTQDLIQDCNAREGWNDLSYVLRIDYGGRRIILAGDAEEKSWEVIQSNFDAGELKCDILKASHHGRLSGYSASATDAMDPAVVICSVGRKPDTDASAKYRAHGAEVFSTRYHGTIVAQIWQDGRVSVYDSEEEISSLPALS